MSEATPHPSAVSQSVVEGVTRTPLSGSKKIYVESAKGDFSVAMREIHLTPTLIKGEGEQAEYEQNAPLRVYDTSGPYTDSQAQIDLYKGLAPMRARWIEDRADSEQLGNFTSDFTRQRLAQEDVSQRFPNKPKPRRALAGKNVTQMH